MKKTTLLKSMLLLCALVVGSGSVWAVDYALYSGGITEGDYVIYYSGKALRNTISSNRFGYTEVTPVENKISNPSADIVWHIAQNGEYWTIYSEDAEKYAGGTSSKNQGALLASVTDYAKWTVTGTSTYEFENKGRAEGSSDKNNKWLRNNGTSGWACYSTSTGGAVSLYKKVEESGAVTTVTINTSGITNTNKFLGTDAGTLTATIKAGDTPILGTVTWSSETESVATINPTTGAVTLVAKGTTRITASYAGVSGTYKSSSAEYILTVTDEDPTLLYEEKTSFGTGETSGTLETLITYSSNQGGAGTAPAIYNSGIRLYQISGTNSYGGFITMTVPTGYKITGFAITTTSQYASTKVDYTVDGSTDVGEGESLAKDSEYAKDGLFNSSVSIFCLGSGSSSRLEIASIKVYYTHVVTITSAKWASFSSSSALDFTGTDVTAYIAKEKDASNVTLTPIVKVPANTGIVVNAAAAGTYAIPVLSGDADATTGNLLHAWLTSGTPSEATYYVLGVSGTNPIFKESTGGILAAGKSYLVLPGGGGAHELNIDIENGSETTGIQQVTSEKRTTEGYFNLAGQRVAQPTKGLYIVNGKKVIIK